VAIQYPSLGPQHPPRLEAIVRAAPWPTQVVAMEMFARDSDYQGQESAADSPRWTRCTVMHCASAEGRRAGRRLRQAVGSALDRLRPQVVVVNGWGHRESRESLRWLRRRRCPWVLLSDSSLHDRPRHWYLEASKRWLLRGCPAAFVAGSPQARYAERLGVPRHIIFHPGSCVVDNQWWAEGAARARQHADEVRRQHGLPERYFVVVARLIAKKNLPLVVRAFARYRQLAAAPDHELVVCGAGPEEASIRRTIGELGLAHVHLAGFIATAELPAFYGLASCLVVPSSHFEQWGLVVNEGMACGLPVLVSHQVGAAEDLVREGDNGHLFDPDDADELARRMVELAGDGELRQRMGVASQRIIRGHSCDVGARNLWRAVAAALGRELPEGWPGDG
jgi:glycosyltransferase involved in cell wall biosynthesis